MLWEKMLDKKRSGVLGVFFVVLFLFTRLVGLKTDNINPDAVNWHYRSQQFIVGLKQLDFEKTYQHYHPGVVLMWVTGVPIEIYKQVIGIQHYDHENFVDFHFVAKISLVLTQLVLSIMILFFLGRIIGFDRALLVIAVLSLEPFFLGNERAVY